MYKRDSQRLKANNPGLGKAPSSEAEADFSQLSSGRHGALPAVKGLLILLKLSATLLNLTHEIQTRLITIHSQVNAREACTFTPGPNSLSFHGLEKKTSFSSSSETWISRGVGGGVPSGFLPPEHLLHMP